MAETGGRFSKKDRNARRRTATREERIWTIGESVHGQLRRQRCAQSKSWNSIRRHFVECRFRANRYFFGFRPKNYMSIVCRRSPC